MAVPATGHAHTQTAQLQQNAIAYLGGVSDLSSKLAPRPLSDAPILDSPIGLDSIHSLGDSSFAGLADSRRGRMHPLHVAQVRRLALVRLPFMKGSSGG